MRALATQIEPLLFHQEAHQTKSIKTQPMYYLAPIIIDHRQAKWTEIISTSITSEQ